MTTQNPKRGKRASTLGAEARQRGLQKTLSHLPWMKARANQRLYGASRLTLRPIDAAVAYQLHTNPCAGLCASGSCLKYQGGDEQERKSCRYLKGERSRFPLNNPPRFGTKVMQAAEEPPTNASRLLELPEPCRNQLVALPIFRKFLPLQLIDERSVPACRTS